MGQFKIEKKNHRHSAKKRDIEFPITWGNKCVVFSLEELGFFLIPQFDWVGGANSRIRKKLIPQFQINGDNEIFFVELEKT